MMMLFQDTLDSLQQIFGLTANSIAIITLMVIAVFIVTKFSNFILKRLDDKNDKQFEVIYKLIENDDFLTKIENSPYLIKQLFYKRFYVLNGFRVEEIEFLLSKSSMELSLYDLNELKHKKLLLFNRGEYQRNLRFFISSWIDEYVITNKKIAVTFIIAIGIDIFLVTINSYLYYIGLMLILIAEVYLLLNHEAVKIYKNNQNEIYSLINASRQYKAANEQQS